MNNNLKNWFAGIGAVLLVLLMVYLGVLIRNAWNESTDITKLRTISMSGEGKVTAKPDTASLSFSVVTTGKVAVDVQKQNDQKMSQVIDFLKASGIAEEDIKTTGYNLYPQYDYTKPTSAEQQQIVGYSLNQTVTAKLKNLDSVAAIVGGLTAKGVNQIDTISYYIDDPDALRAKAREQAVQKAKDKAQELAKNLGVKLGRVVNFSENGSTPVPIPYGADARGLGGGSSPVQPGSQDVVVDVNLTFELK